MTTAGDTAMCVILFILQRLSISNIYLIMLLVLMFPARTVNGLYRYTLFVCYSFVAPTFSFQMLDLTWS